LGFELGDQAAGFIVGVEAAGEEAGAEFVAGRAAGQDVPDDDEDGVGDHVEGLEVPVVADRGPGGLDQDQLEVLVAVAALAGAPFSGGFVIARAQASPGGQVRGVGEQPKS
jgi:hypothetical protein